MPQNPLFFKEKEKYFPQEGKYIQIPKEASAEMYNSVTQLTGKR